jgi:predicted ABC-type ATPase
MPTLYIISGCNGAGKTTASMTILPEILKCKEFVNADSIASGLSPLNPDSVSFQSGRLMLKRIDELLNEDENFAIETTLTTLSYISLIKKAKRKNYKIILIYFWLETINLANQRIAERVKKGGHSVEKNIVKRRYYRGIYNLFNIFIPHVNEWIVFDNSGLSSEKVSENFKGIDIIVYKQDIWNNINKAYEKAKRILKR